ncbi:AsmA-like C-terminal region-containing protein [Alteromonas sp. a30]|uniref:AsmA-like C-terminal region-containing protein n=1 Tax=Alteromonas sp. a30 TaxID=2730917 RepID=UPI002282C46F|nr:AsmA-like C-terminal region-containing protein [Alteromonas sp. a30]MCY7294703.1 hypothetical protein [Alteromonas sp. a30]
MSKRNIVFFILAIPLLIIGLVVAFWNPNWFKSDIEQQLETVPHVDVTFGNIQHSLMSPGDLVVENIQLSGELVSGNIASLTIKTQVNPLFSKQVIVDEIILDKPNLSFNALALTQIPTEPAASDAMPTQESEPLPIELLLVKSVKVQNANLQDISEQKLFSVNNLNISVENIGIVENSLVLTPEQMQPVSLNISTGRTQIATYFTGILKLALEGNGKTIVLEDLQAKTEKSLITLNGTIQDPLNTPLLSLTLDDSQLNLDEFSAFFEDLPVKPAGSVNFSGQIDDFLLADNTDALLQNLTGEFNLDFNQGKLIGIDVNQMVKALKATQEADMTDIGSFLLTGPVGILASQIYDLGSGTKGLKGETSISQLQFSTQIDHGVFDLQKTAIATDKYRMALSGGLDLVSNKFNDFTFSLLDEKGCVDIQQVFKGDFDDPSGTVRDTLFNTVTGPISGLFKGLVKPKKNCKPVYEGEVEHPTGSNN